MKNSLKYVIAGTVALLAACSDDKKEERREHAASSAATAAGGGEVKPDPGGKEHEIHLFSNEKGNYYEPAEITVSRGDVVKFELKSGVHNVSFLPDSNPGKTNLPAPSEMLQLPDQEFYVKIIMEPGKYYYQCDPHALLGMKGHITVK